MAMFCYKKNEDGVKYQLPLLKKSPKIAKISNYEVEIELHSKKLKSQKSAQAANTSISILISINGVENLLTLSDKNISKYKLNFKSDVKNHADIEIRLISDFNPVYVGDLKLYHQNSKFENLKS